MAVLPEPEPEPEPVATLPEPDPVTAPVVEPEPVAEPEPVGVRPIAHDPAPEDQDAYANWWTVQLGSPLEAA